MGFIPRRKLYQQVWLDLVRSSKFVATSLVTCLIRLIAIDHLYQFVYNKKLSAVSSCFFFFFSLK